MPSFYPRITVGFFGSKGTFLAAAFITLAASRHVTFKYAVTLMYATFEGVFALKKLHLFYGSKKV